MKWLFGQTWLYALIAFLLGALITWLFFVRPRKRSVTVTEENIGRTGNGAGGPGAHRKAAAAPEPVAAAAKPVTLASAAEPAPASAAAFVAGPYANSAMPLDNGDAPDGFTIKGNEDSMLFHAPESPYYGRTKAEMWFRTAADAEAAGFTAWNKRG